MIKVLFLIPNLGSGGAEKVLVNLVNHMDVDKFKITVMTLYDEGVNKTKLAKHICYRYCFKSSFFGISHILKLFIPEKLFSRLITEKYDIVVSYLEGQTARIIGGCKSENVKKVCWIHRTITTMEDFSRLFRSKEEAIKCYNSFDAIVSVSKDVQRSLMRLLPLENKGIVLYNVNDSDLILKKSTEFIEDKNLFKKNEIKICAVGSLIPIKGFDRLISIHIKLKKQGYPIHTYILGEGREKKHLVKVISENDISDSITLLGYCDNPYKYMKQCDLFVCSSYSEGLSTAVTEALILGIPVVTTNVSGMEELLGDNNEYGIVVKNNDESLFNALAYVLSNDEILSYYRRQAIKRGRQFETRQSVQRIERFFFSMME